MPFDVVAGVVAPLLIAGACAGAVQAAGAVRRSAAPPIAPTATLPAVQEVALATLGEPDASDLPPDPPPEAAEDLAAGAVAAGQEGDGEAATPALDPPPAVEATPTVQERPRPRPRRDYVVPLVARSTTWPFGPNVYRWQPLVEQQLRTIRATRRLDPAITTELVLAMINAESVGDPLATSSADAVGLMQLLPSTFAELMGDADPFDPELNVRAGILYLNRALAAQGGDVEWALAGYNAGIGAARRARDGDKDLVDETLDYVETVLNLRDRAILLRGSAPPLPPSPAPATVRDRLRPTEERPAATPTGTILATAAAAGAPTGTVTPGPTLAAASTAPAASPASPASPPRPPQPAPGTTQAAVGTSATGTPAATASGASSTATSSPTATPSPTPAPSPEATRVATGTATMQVSPSGAATATTGATATTSSATAGPTTTAGVAPGAAAR